MQLRKSSFPRGVLQGIVAASMVLAVVGCSYKPGYLKGVSTEVPQRWKVEKMAPARLSPDQRTTLEDRGPPTYVRFYREVELAIRSMPGSTPIQGRLSMWFGSSTANVWKTSPLIAIPQPSVRPPAAAPARHPRGHGRGHPPTVLLVANR